DPKDRKYRRRVKKLIFLLLTFYILHLIIQMSRTYSFTRDWYLRRSDLISKSLSRIISDSNARNTIIKNNPVLGINEIEDKIDEISFKSSILVNIIIWILSIMIINIFIML